jgi:hypothetical protein
MARVRKGQLKWTLDVQKCFEKISLAVPVKRTQPEI